MIAQLALAAAAGAIIGRLLNRVADRLSRNALPRAHIAPSSRPFIYASAFELIAAALCALAWWSYGPTPLLVSRVLFGCGLIVLFTVDLERHQLPNAVTLPGVAIGLAFSFFIEPGWRASAIGTVAGGGLLWV